MTGITVYASRAKWFSRGGGMKGGEKGKWKIKLGPKLGRDRLLGATGWRSGEIEEESERSSAGPFSTIARRRWAAVRFKEPKGEDP
jgi:hypothetical protein